MKNRISLFLLTAVLCLLAGACVKDQASVFDKSASERLTEALNHAQQVLQQPENGWLMCYYPHPDQYYGGYNFVVKFTADEVTAWSELSNPDESYTSLYKMTRDDGPILSFDMDNYLLHYFATPSGTNNNRYGENGMYQGYQGDFEFIILSAEADRVELKGKRSGCHIELLPMTTDPETFLTGLQQAKENNFRIMGKMYVSSFETTFGGKTWSLTIDRDDQQVSVVEKGTDQPAESAAYLYTDQGLRLYRDLDLDGTLLRTFGWDADNEVMTDDEAHTWHYVLPEGWVSYEDYLGEYTLHYNDNRDWFTEEAADATVTLEKNVEQESFWLTGINDNYRVKVDYNLAEGSLSIMGQIVGTYSGNDVFFAALYSYKHTDGSPTFTGWRSTKYGIKTSVDLASLENDPDHMVLYFVPGPSAAGKPINSFGLLMQTPAGASGGWMSNAKDWYMFGDTFYSLFWYSLTKK